MSHKRFIAAVTAAAALAAWVPTYAAFSADKSLSLTASSQGESFIVSDALYPQGEISLGSAYSIDGVITASAQARSLKVWGGVYTADGDSVLYHEEQTDTAVCDLGKTFDPVMSFNALPAGKYIYKIEAADDLGNTAEVISSEFTIVDNGKLPSDLKILDCFVPGDNITGSCGFSAYGRITSSYTINKVWGGIYTAGGKATKQYYETEPNKNSFDLKNGFTDNISLDGLAEGGLHIQNICIRY